MYGSYSIQTQRDTLSNGREFYSSAQSSIISFLVTHFIYLFNFYFSYLLPAENPHHQFIFKYLDFLIKPWTPSSSM